MTRRIPRRQAGLTLIELLVACAVSLLIAIAAASALLSSRQGFSTVDAAAQLRDNARFAADLITRVALQAGYRDTAYAATERPPVAGAPSNPVPPVYGADDARPSTAAPASGFLPNGHEGSDVLVLRYQVPETSPGTGVPDSSMIDCSGASAPNTALPRTRDDLLANVYYVAIYKDEPTLMCVVVDPAGTVGRPQPLVAGVETFQVLYGTDGVVPSAAPTLPADSVVDRMLRAKQLEVPADLPGTYANWRRVRALRIGMVLRGPRAPVEDRTVRTFFPLGSGMDSADDAGSKFTPPGDNRFRQVLTFTVHLRNDQGI